MLPDDPGRMGWWSLGREYRDKGLEAELGKQLKFTRKS